MSQAPALARHSSPGLQPFGQSPLQPVQTSSRSQIPALGPHSVSAGKYSSGGQAAWAPLQTSGASQGPSAGRLVSPLGSRASTGQCTLLPSQRSVRSQGPAASRHNVPAGAAMVAGQAALLPSQTPTPQSRWQLLPGLLSVQSKLQHGPPSHSSQPLTAPSPQEPGARRISTLR